MIYLIRPVEREHDIILYICSTKETTVVLDELSKLDIDLLSKDDGVISDRDDPFLFMQINNN